MDDTEFLTQGETAELMRMSTQTLREWEQKGEGPPTYRISERKVLYKRAEVLEWLDTKKSN